MTPKWAECGLPRLLAITAALAFGIFAVAVAVARRDGVAFPGAMATFAIYLTLGVFIVRGHSWARWVMFTLTALTALTCLVGAFVPTSGPPDHRGTYLLLGSSAYFALIATGLAVPSRCRTG